MINKLESSGIMAFSNFIILDKPSYLSNPDIRDCKVMVVSAFNRSKESVNGLWANMHRDLYVNNIQLLTDKAPYKEEICQLNVGKEKAYHMMAYSSELGKTSFICHKKNIYNDLYEFIMNTTCMPLLKEWMQPLLNKACNENMASVGHTLITSENISDVKIRYNSKNISISEMEVVRFNPDENWIANALKQLHDEGIIHLSEQPQKPFEAVTIDDYLTKYSHSIVENLKNKIHPLTELEGNIKNVALKKIRLYPQQIAQVIGGQKLLDRQNYLLQIEGMGTGKTVQSLAVCEGRENQKYMEKNNVPLSECLKNDNVHYRTFVMCPGHLPEKWAREIMENIPYSHVTILHTLEDVINIKKLPKKAERKEFYIAGKEFCKLSYMLKPAATKVRKKKAYNKICINCGNTVDKGACNCGCTDTQLEYAGFYDIGLTCPECGNLLYGNKVTADNVLQPVDFAEHNSRNDKCFYCGTSLWEPCVNNLGSSHRAEQWYRVSHYANKSHKTKKTAWILKGYEEQYKETMLEPCIELKNIPIRKVRKVAPATYMAKYLKGYFDYGIFDEAHQYKGGGTAQGNAFAAIASICKKKLLLTGTIANGYANALFYLLYRVNPARMKELGFNWTDELKFAEKYGVIETLYEANDDGAYNSCSRGRQMGIPKVLPGISPMLTLDFTLPNEITLDLTDMSRFLPPLYENVAVVDMPEEIAHSYNSVMFKLKSAIKQKDGGRTLLSAMLQYGLSYPDKPYCRSNIIAPRSGETIAMVDNYDVYKDKLLPKEEKLLDIVKNEMSEKRNVVVFAEYTSSAETIITTRIKEVLENNIPELKGHVYILESTSVEPIKREGWIRKVAEDGCKVIITNPKCVETGLDFIWSEKDSMGNEKIYNFPTLIFFQTGSNLYTTWQASRRAYRLIQKEECRNFYLAYKNTLQLDYVQMLAEKQTATLAIQGKFSADGLARMATQVDPRVKLAQSLCEADKESSNDLQAMFDVINDANNTASDVENVVMSEYTPMKLFDEIIEASGDIEINDSFSSFNFNKFFQMFEKTPIIDTDKTFEKRSNKITANEQKVKLSIGHGKQKCLPDHIDLLSML